MEYPRLRKANRIIGKNLILRNACISDAAFILSLRTDAKKARNISRGAALLADQEAWLEQYAFRDEAYFIIENKSGEPLGTIRLYDSVGYSFCWGSWIVKDGAPQSVAVESSLMAYAYALDTLGFLTARIQVNKDNETVWRFKERFGATRIAEDNTQYEYIITNDAIRASLQRYKRYLPISLIVEN